MNQRHKIIKRFKVLDKITKWSRDTLVNPLCQLKVTSTFLLHSRLLHLSIAVKASGSDLRIHFKNTYETGKAVKGMHLKTAIKYMKDVLAHKRCVPFTRFRKHTGRTGQAKEFGFTQGIKRINADFLTEK